jgi:hypothetical protein
VMRTFAAIIAALLVGAAGGYSLAPQFHQPLKNERAKEFFAPAPKKELTGGQELRPRW